MLVLLIERKTILGKSDKSDKLKMIKQTTNSAVVILDHMVEKCVKSKSQFAEFVSLRVCGTF